MLNKQGPGKRNKAHEFMIKSNEILINENHRLKAQEDNYKKLYIASNDLLCILGAEGSVISDDDAACELMSVLADIDGGQYDVKKVFKI